MHTGLPQQQQQQGKDTSPANIFAQMKAGTFANDAAPQSSGERSFCVLFRFGQAVSACEADISLFFPFF